jgi:hypothetical integral membrane protein (TIGR02206 family)
VQPFRRLGLEHTGTLVALAATAVWITRWLKRGGARDGRIRGEAPVRIGLAALLAGGLLYALVDSLPLRGLDWLEILPLHLCDMAVLVAIWALATRQRTASEILYFWGLSGTLIAMLTPDVDRGFPDSRCISFFALHGGVAVSAAVVAFGIGPRPRPRANLRVFAITNMYAAVIGVLDALADKNFLYLRQKPSEPSILDWMGPWPWYILAADALAFALFAALMIPFRNGERDGSPSKNRSPVTPSRRSTDRSSRPRPES